MSHNKITVGGQAPDLSGDISIGLGDLSDVSGSPSSGQTLKYNGSAWAPASSSINTALPYSMHSSRTWSVPNGATSGFTYSLGGWHTFSLGGAGDLIGGPYSTDPFWEKATAPPAPYSSIYWNMGFNVTAGDWLLIGTPNVQFGGSSDFIDWAWFDNAGTQYGNRVRAAGGRTSSVACWAIVSIASTTQIFLKCLGISGTVSLTASDQQKSMAFQFIRLG